MIMLSQERGFNKDLGQMVRIARTVQGLTQRDLANHLGISHQQMQKYEAGENAITVYRLHKISTVLETSFAKCLMHDQTPFNPRSLSQRDYVKSLTYEEMLTLLMAVSKEVYERRKV
jgi:transcriptional regulator with XRE-family HTH domain